MIENSPHPKTRGAAPRQGKAALESNHPPQDATQAGNRKRHFGTRHARARCVRLLKARLGPRVYQEFLRTRQPALGERTGADLLLNAPGLLLERIAMLEQEGGR